jgi:tyrosyl-tRNA synthetase
MVIENAEQVRAVLIEKEVANNPFLKELHSRGVISNLTPGTAALLNSETVTGYCGFDPTARSLHVGSFLLIMALARLQRYGHRPLAIVGGGTGLIGDPSGKTKERNLLTEEQVAENLEGIRQQLSQFLDFQCKGNPATIVNNADWLCSERLLDFMRDVGKYISVNDLMKKESVKKRLEKEEGLSLTEFIYGPLQAYDFLILFDRYGCRLQLGGSDQTGNIFLGIDLIRRLRSVQAHGLVLPLIENSNGVKFGKTESGTIWLSPELTSPYKFYQFFFNTDDRDVGRYLRYFTWLDQTQIAELDDATMSRPGEREAQRRLATEVTKLVHGTTETAKAVRASNVLFGEEIGNLAAGDVSEIFSDVPTTSLPADWLDGARTVIDLAVVSQLTPSRGEARRLIQAGGFYVNNRRMTDPATRVTAQLTIEGRYIVLRKGARQYLLITLQE